MKFEEYTCQNDWSVKWSCSGLSQDGDFMAMFKCNNAGPNMLLSLRDLKDAVLTRKAMPVPHDVMVFALTFLSQSLGKQIEERIVA